MKGVQEANPCDEEPTDIYEGGHRTSEGGAYRVYHGSLYPEV